MSKIVRMLGGLANRMFQYSLSEYIKLYGEDVLVDNYYKPSKWMWEDFDWNRIFPEATLNLAPKKQIFLYGGGYDIISKVRRKLHLTYKYYAAPSAFDIPTIEDIYIHSYFQGIFQNTQMVGDVKDIVQKKFIFCPFEDAKNTEVQKRMENCNSVAIHVRKGKDYLTSPTHRGVCELSYYHAAIQYIKERVENPVFFVFTDNVDWINKHFNGIDYILVNHNPCIGWGNHFDMQLISYAKHNVIANSTYSWWGAFLNKNPSKIVIGPKQWFNVNSKSGKLKNTTLFSDWVAL